MEIVEKINNLKKIQKEYWEDVEFPKEIQAILDSCEIVAEGLDVDKHRWYETSTVVYKLNEQYFGITYVTDTFSENSSIEDMYWEICAVPMKQVQTITYEEL